MMESLPKSGSFRNQMLFGLCDGLSSLVIGATCGYTSTSLISMYKDSDFEITEEQGNWIGSIIPGMALIGSVFSNRILEYLGRKNSLLLSALLSSLTWLMVGYASNVYYVIAARLCSGFFIGLQQVAISVYVSETVHPKLRPVFNIFPAIAGSLGFMILNVIPETVASWRGLAIIGALLNIPLTVLLLSLSESPFYLLKSGEKEKALKCLISLRDTREEAETEFKGLEKNVASLKKTLQKINFSTLFSPPNRWPVTIAILLHLFQPLTGFIVLSTFMGLVFERASSIVDASVATLFLTAVNMSSIVLTVKLPSIYGRRTLMKWSSQIIIGGHIALSLYLLMKERGSPLTSLFSLIPFLSFLAYAVGFSLAWGPVPWIFIGDGLPLKVRGDVASLIIAFNWGFNFIVSKTFSWGTFYLGYSGLLAFYGFSTFIGMIIMQNHLPETFGFTAPQIDKYYEDAYAASDKKKKS